MLSPTWRYVGPMLGSCYAHADPVSPPYEILPIFKNHGKTQYSRAKKGSPSPPDSHMKLYMKLYWASLGPLLHAYQPMLGPCWPHITPSWSIRHYVRPMLGLCWAHLGPIRHYIGAILGLCWPHVTLMLAHFLQLTNFWHSSKTMEKPSILEQKRPPPQKKMYKKLILRIFHISYHSSITTQKLFIKKA